MIKTTGILLQELKDYASPANKLARMAKNGEVFPIVKGLYETDPKVPGYLLAASIYGPSYLSFEFALSLHGLIPEAVYLYTSATFKKRKRKFFSTPFGDFSYRDVPAAAFPWGLELRKEGEYYYRVACAEKALCDQLYTRPPVANTKELYTLLTSDIRIEEEDLQNLDTALIESFIDKYKTTNVRKLHTLLRRIK